MQSEAAITAQAAYCGTSSTTIFFSQVIDYDYSVSPPKPIYGTMPEGTYFRAVDNATFTDRILYEGFTGASGLTTFSYANCDPAGSGQPDVYFIFETRSSKGITASHGTVKRRHWWRTNTYWDYAPSNFDRRRIVAIGDNAEAINTQRLWYKVNRVYDWNRTALGDNSTFKVDFLYPASDYFGIATSRAAIGQVQLVYAHANVDDIIFHEFGHEVYYRRMLGDYKYHVSHACAMKSGCTPSFPACGGCIGHSISKNIGPEAAMIEGWAGFFEGVTALNVPATNVRSGAPYKYIEDPNDRGGVPTGPGAELRVAAYLWDFWDDNTTIADFVYDNDAVVSTGTAKERYKKVAGYFKDMSISSEFINVWRTNIKPTLDSTELLNHQKILNLNTLGGVY